MTFKDDIIARINFDFGENASKATTMLLDAINKVDYLKTDRVIRCIIFLAKGNLTELNKYIETATFDTRDVMFWAEYVGIGENEKPKRVRDFNKAFADSSSDIREQTMNLIQEYLELTKTCASTDYGDKKSVRLHNKSVDRMYEIAEKIGYEQTTETIADFAKLLDIKDNKTNVWAAVHLLERIPSDKITQEKALKIIKRQADGDTAEAMGFRIWLDNYKKK